MAEGERLAALNAANVVTLLRLPLAALVWPFRDSAVLLLALMAGAAVSDMVDGSLARRARARAIAAGAPLEDVRLARAVGALLDPICDKLFMVSLLGAIWWSKAPPLEWLALIALREIIQVPAAALYVAIPGLHRRVGFDFTAGVPGKAATVVQFAAVVAMLLELRIAGPVAWTAGAFGLVSAAYYFHRATVTVRQMNLEATTRTIQVAEVRGSDGSIPPDADRSP